MSETIRSYSASGRVGYDTPFSGRRSVRRLVPLVIVALFAWLFWSTRDTCPIERLVPRDQTFHLQARQLLVSREKAAASPLWNLGLLPERYKSFPEWLGNDFGLPDWVLNNLVSDVCYVSGKDFNEFTDLLVVTRMSRIGCLIERYHAFTGSMEDDFAGGLRLRRLTGTEMHYAVRGRTLALSPSREALIAALTLREGDAVDQLQEMVPGAAGDVQGMITLPEADPLGQYVRSADFVLSFAPSSVHFSVTGVVRPSWRSSLDILAGRGAGNGSMPIPDAGGMVLAGNFDVALPEAWQTVDDMSGGALGNLAGALPLLRTGATDTWKGFWAAMRAGLGTEFSLRWTGFDVDGAPPLPELELYTQTRPDASEALLEIVPSLEAGYIPEDWTPYRDAETGRIHIPIGWGGVVEPVLETVPEGLRMALHPVHLAHIPYDAGTAQDVGQLFLRVRPAEVLELLLEGGSIYADAGLIPGHTLESFQEAMAALQAGSRQLTEVRLTAKYHDGILSLDVVADLQPES